MIKWIIVAGYLGAILYVHFRGKVRLRIWRQFLDHSALVAPINCFMYAFSGVPRTPYIPVENFPDLEKLRAAWPEIRDEGLALAAMQKIKAADKNDDAGFNSFFKYGWKRFYLKWYEAQHPSAEVLCPKTVALLRELPTVKAAMFAELPPGGKLNPHRDPFAGSLRYHLGLSTPNDDRCFIEVDGERHSWRDGQGVVFDETYLHWAENRSDANRLILFCDIERPMRYGWAAKVNHWMGRKVMTAASSPNDEHDQTGMINRLFRFVWLGGQYRRRFKAWNRQAYYVTKFGLIVLGVVLIVYL
ncbi:lipid A hydroxylase LpxO [Cupriavidus necator]|uniref:lipid A hydroxylase LpxO n=1 Tax=Cupriavidus necator TaxID=106590 RepID=UPI00339D35C9